MNELVEIAIVAYRVGRHKDAIELLSQVTAQDPSNWMARLYLAMCYEKCGRIVDAHKLLKQLSEVCPDSHIRFKAVAALPIIESEIKRRFGKQVEQSEEDDDAAQPIGRTAIDAS